jgi:hypothetical protein
MFVQRWGILRSAIPKGITLRKTTALVLALAKIHNFCIEQTYITILPLTAGDEIRMISRDVGSIPLELDPTVIEVENDNNDDYRIPRQLIGAGDHFEDMQKQIRDNR